MSFRKLGAVILLVSNMNTSIQFYKDVLNIPLKYRSDDWTEFFNKGKLKTGQHILIGFSASDFDNTIKSLEEKKVAFFKSPREEVFGKHAIIEDPDGHLISIVKLKENPQAGEEGFDFLGMIGAE